MAEPVRVLIVDDNAHAADALADLLNLEGYAALACYSEPVGLHLATHTAPQIVVIDLGMPERGGHVLAGQIRSALPRSLLIAFTGSSNVADIERSKEVGLDAHWVKPMTGMDFAHALGAAWLRHRQLTATALP